MIRLFKNKIDTGLATHEFITYMDILRIKIKENFKIETNEYNQNNIRDEYDIFVYTLAILALQQSDLKQEDKAKFREKIDEMWVDSIEHTPRAPNAHTPEELAQVCKKFTDEKFLKQQKIRFLKEGCNSYSWAIKNGDGKDNYEKISIKFLKRTGERHKIGKTVKAALYSSISRHVPELIGYLNDTNDQFKFT